MGLADGSSWEKEYGVGKQDKPSTPTEVKQDQGKLRYDLMPFDALDEVAKVLTYGVIKYPKPEENWRVNSTIEDIPRYKAAILRHFSAMSQGEVYDMGTPENPGTLRPHMACIATNSLFILALEKKFGVYDEQKILRGETNEQA